MSFCSASGNSGFVHLAGPLQSTEVKAITVTSYFPVTLSFTARTTPPMILNGNEIQEENTHECLHRGNRYSLANIQLCAPLHKGYKLPEDPPNQTPVAECILTYRWKQGENNKTPSHAGILLCLPLYDSGQPAYDTYLDQIVNDPDLACGYENQVGKRYEGADQKTIQDTTLRTCVKACCDDAQCLAYTFGSGTCHIKHTIPNLLSTGDNTISGKIKRGEKPAAATASSATGIAAPLSSLFYEKEGQTTHSVIAYPTCFESMKDQSSYTNHVYVMVFPKGVRMRPASYQQLLLRMNGVLPAYRVPPVLRNSGKTILRYRMENGTKTPTEWSDAGEVYTTTVSTASEEFVDRFEYFIVPPRPSSTASKRRTIDQYKCVPFNESTDLVDGKTVIPGKGTLEEILAKQKQAKEKATNAASGGAAAAAAPSFDPTNPETAGAIIGGIVGAGFLMLAIYLLRRVFNRPPE